MTRTLGLRIGGIIVQLDEDGKGGSITSDLHYGETSEIEELFDDNEQWQKYEGAVDGLESLILAHAVAGIDVLSREYREGVQTAVDAIGNES